MGHSFDNSAEPCEKLLLTPNLSLPADVELEVVDLSDDPNVPQTTSINANLSQSEKTQLIALLKEYVDVFTWEYNEMSGLDPSLVAHALNVELGVKTMIQPMRTFHSNIEAQIIQEVQKLHVASFVKPIEHLKWLSNIVPIKKKNEQIRCCVDFRNLNKACPKDEFPLPNMDMLIDSATEHAMFSFIDGFSGYNQIRMSPKDAAKTAFRTPIEICTIPLCPLASRTLVPFTKGPWLQYFMICCTEKLKTMWMTLW